MALTTMYIEVKDATGVLILEIVGRMALQKLS